MPRVHRIRLASHATGEERVAWVYVYPSPWHVVAAAHRFNGSTFEPDTLAVTQAWADESGRVTEPIIRLPATRLGSQILSHEIAHAATAIYGSSSINEPLDHANEPLAHLVSDLFVDLVAGLRQRRLIP